MIREVQMKKLVLLVFICLALSLGAQISDPEALEYGFNLTQIQPYLLEGTLRMHNPTQYVWNYTFPNLTIADILVDGFNPGVVYLPALCPVTIYAGETVTLNIGEYLYLPLTQGVHTTQAELVIGTGYPVGNIEVIYNFQTMDEISALDWELQIDEVYPDSLEATLNFTNNTSEPWYHEYYAVPTFYLTVDNNILGGFMWIDFPMVFVVEPFETISLELSYRNYIDGVLTEFTPGTHTLQAHTRLSPGQPVADTRIFTYTPSTNDDQILNSLSLTAYPNPFIQGTNISIKNDKARSREMEIYNLRGQLVRKLSSNQGESSYWDGTDNQGRSVSPGVYLLKQMGSRGSSLKLLKLN